MMVLPKDETGRVRHYRNLDEELIPYKAPGTIEKGAIVSIISGTHDGMFAVVLSLDKQKFKAKLRLRNELVGMNFLFSCPKTVI